MNVSLRYSSNKTDIMQNKIFYRHFIALIKYFSRFFTLLKMMPMVVKYGKFSRENGINLRRPGNIQI